MKPQTQQRNKAFDIARGIAILGMLYGHAMAWQGMSGSLLTHWFWSFNMPLFALIAGYFHVDKSFIVTLKNGIKTLLMPYYVVCFVLFIINLTSCQGGGVICSISTFYKLIKWSALTLLFFNIPSGFWFVIALFNCRLILSIISIFKWKYMHLTLVVISLIIVFCPWHIEYFELSHTFALLPFIIIGIYAKQYDLFCKPISKSMSIILIILLGTAQWMFVDIWRYNFPLSVFNYITSPLICYALILCCRFMDKSKIDILFPLKKILSFSGQHSMSILAFQAILGIDFIHFASRTTCIDNPYILMLFFVFACVSCTIVFVMTSTTILGFRKKIN